jgi:hypothetical protein
MKKKQQKTNRQLSLEFSESAQNVVEVSLVNLGQSNPFVSNVIAFPRSSSIELSFRERIKADLIRNKVSI